MFIHIIGHVAAIATILGMGALFSYLNATEMWKVGTFPAYGKAIVYFISLLFALAGIFGAIDYAVWAYGSFDFIYLKG